MNSRILYVIFIFLPSCLLAQDQEVVGGQSIPYISLVLGGFVLAVLLMGIIVQARWKEK